MAGRRRGYDDEERLGRLVDEEQAERRIFSGRYVKAGLGSLRAPHRASTRPDMGGGRTTFHFQQTYVSKRPDKFGGAELSEAVEARRPDRVYLYPRRREVAVARALGARYDRAARRPWLPAGHPAAGDPRAQAMRTPAARTAWRKRALGRGRTPDLAQAGGEAARFQAYVMRGGLDEEGREAELAHDAEGPVAVSSIGDTVEAATDFWRRVEARERADGRVQLRLFIEVAHELPEEELRPLAEALARVFRERGLPHYVGMHRADVDKGSDPRNIHIHLLYSDRPAVHERDPGSGDPTWRFAPRKDREAQGPAWIAGLRERVAAELGQALDRAAQRAAARSEDQRAAARGRDDGAAGRGRGERAPALGAAERRAGAPGAGRVADAVRAAAARWAALMARRYDVRSYDEAETGKVPSHHLGRVRAQRERAGLPTLAGVRNAAAETDYAEVEIAAVRRVLAREAEAVLSRTRMLRERDPRLAGRAVVAALELDRSLREAADRFEARQRAADDPAVVRARLRLDWIQRERRRLELRQRRLGLERAAGSRPAAVLERLERRVVERGGLLDAAAAEAIRVLRPRGAGGERDGDAAAPGTGQDPHGALRGELAVPRARWRERLAELERALEARRVRWAGLEAGRLGIAGELAEWTRRRRRRAAAEVVLERRRAVAERAARIWRAPRREAAAAASPSSPDALAEAALARLAAAAERARLSEAAAARRVPARLRDVLAGSAPVPRPAPSRTPQRERDL